MMVENGESWHFPSAYRAYSLRGGEQGEVEQMVCIGSVDAGGETDEAGELPAYTKSAL